MKLTSASAIDEDHFLSFAEVQIFSRFEASILSSSICRESTVIAGMMRYVLSAYLRSSLPAVIVLVL